MSGNERQPQRENIAALIGPTGAGKTYTALTAKKALMRMGYVFNGISDRLDDQDEAAAYHGKTKRTTRMGGPEACPDGGQPEAEEFLRYITPDGPIRLESWAGEDTREGDGVNLPMLVERIERIDLPVLCANAFCHDTALATWGLIEGAWWWQTQTSFDLGRAVGLSAELLWDVTPEGLNKLNIGWNRMPPEVLQDARLVRSPDARFGQDVQKAFRVEGVTPAAGQRLMTCLQRMAETIPAAHSTDWQTTRELARLFPYAVLVVTHGDLLKYLPGLSRGDLRDFGCRAFARPEDVRLSQVVVQASVDLVLQNDSDEPIWKKGPRDSADELLTAVSAQLRARRQQGQGDGVPPPRWRRQLWAAAGVAFAAGILTLALPTITGAAWLAVGLVCLGWMAARAVNSIRRAAITPRKASGHRPVNRLVRPASLEAIESSNGKAQAAAGV